jgi:6-pyruvoyltetrahydropterin/6-carboxytetrahydropterin synthase|nr:MAG TPA: 6-pyruvoyl tetrahydropterin synthase [Caudoviricetes sp.]
MYYVRKELEVSAAHKLELDYESRCTNMHGHNWKITVFCKSDEVNQNGMVIDFKEIKKSVHAVMDHKYLNDVFDFNPTAENIAKWVVDSIPCCYRAEVEESSNNWAAYEE